VTAYESTQKPVAIVMSRHGSGSDPREVHLTRRGIPVIDGEWWALKAARHAFDYHDFRQRGPMTLPAPPSAGVLARWRMRLAASPQLDESDALHLLADIGLPAIGHARADSRESVAAVADMIGYPVALKTAKPGIAHKSDVGGVRLGIGERADLIAAYDEMAPRLGPAVTVAAMAPKGIELALGVVVDPDFGPVVMIGGGGTAIELYRDCAFLLAPFDAATAERAIRRLKVARLLEGYRGAPPGDMAALAKAAARLSVAAIALADGLAEIDINPLIVLPQGCVAVDALARARGASR
jgi:acyl-CoA synthetase (NDP forming)